MNINDGAIVATVAAVGVSLAAATALWISTTEPTAPNQFGGPITIPETSGSTPLEPGQPAPAPTKTPAAVPTIDDGGWTVGVDFPPGTYRPRVAAIPDCYWEITKAGTNGAEIVDNDYGMGGRPTVVLRAGQGFSTRDCGTWVKVK